jgi:bifunctional UDP-N-acetylglucosamine pyrophosphorylase/glucosamine-1-phosphate N-acetyltransferase
MHRSSPKEPRVRALVLAAGRGTGLYPFTETRPKAMLPVAGESLLESALGKLRAAGVTDVVMVVGHRSEKITEFFSRGGVHGMTIQYVRQENPTDIRDAVRCAKEFFQPGEGFLLVYADVLTSGNIYRHVVQTFGSFNQPVAAICHTPQAQNFGTVYLDADMCISKLVEKPSKREMGNYVLAGVFVMPYRLFDLLEDRGMPASINEIIATTGLRSAIWEEPWLDAQHPWDLLKGNQMVMSAWTEARVSGTVQLRGAVQFRGPVCIESDVIIEAGASISGPCFIGEGTFIGNGVLVRPNTSIGAGCMIGFGVELKNCILLDRVRVGRLSYIGDSVLGEEVYIGSGTMTVNHNLERSNVSLLLKDGEVDSEMDKLGSFVGDGANVGASNTLAAGAVIRPGEIVPHHYTYPRGGS